MHARLRAYFWISDHSRSSRVDRGEAELPAGRPASDVMYGIRAAEADLTQVGKRAVRCGLGRGDVSAAGRPRLC